MRFIMTMGSDVELGIKNIVRVVLERISAALFQIYEEPDERTFQNTMHNERSCNIYVFVASNLRSVSR